MSDNPIERLIAAGHTEILEAAGWHMDLDGVRYLCDEDGIWEAEQAKHSHIQLAGMAALEWLTRGRRLADVPRYDEFTGAYSLCLWEQPMFYAPTLAEAAIDAAIAVWEASRGN
jgi:hypothetical protein